MSSIHAQLSHLNSVDELVNFVSRIEPSPFSLFRGRKFHLKDNLPLGEISLKDIVVKTQALAPKAEKTLPPELIFGIRLIDEWGNSTLERISNVFSRVLVAITTFCCKLFCNTFTGFDKTKALEEITQKTILTPINETELKEQTTISANIGLDQLEIEPSYDEDILYYSKFACAYHTLPDSNERTMIYEKVIKLMVSTPEPPVETQRAFTKEWSTIQAIRKIKSDASISKYNNSVHNLVNANKLISMINNPQLHVLIKHLALKELYCLADHSKYPQPEYLLALGKLKEFPKVFSALTTCDVKPFLEREFIRKKNQTVVNAKQFLEIVMVYVHCEKTPKAFEHFMLVHEWKLLDSKTLELVPYTETLSGHQNLISYHHSEIYQSLQRIFADFINAVRPRLMPNPNETDEKSNISTDPNALPQASAPPIDEA